MAPALKEKETSNDLVIYRLELLEGSVQDQQKTLKHIETLLTRLSEGSETKRVDDHENRIRDIESFKWKLVGIVSFIAFVVPICTTALINYFK